jgi:hypothetical protein
VCHSRATSVEVGSLSNAQREYTKTWEKWGENCAVRPAP